MLTSKTHNTCSLQAVSIIQDILFIRLSRNIVLWLVSRNNKYSDKKVLLGNSHCYFCFSFRFLVFFGLLQKSKGDVPRMCEFIMNWSRSKGFRIDADLFSILAIVWWELSVDCSPANPNPKPCLLMYGTQCRWRMCCFGSNFLSGKWLKYAIM